MVQPEYRHEYKGLNFKIYAQHCDRGRRVDHQDHVVEDDHHGTDRLHHDGWQPYFVNIGDDFPVKLEAPDLNTDQMFPLKDDKRAHQHAKKLSGNGRDRGACHLQTRRAEQSKNKNRI